ncbi:hypothetical protein KR018_004586 [Drosophila ironensis]|nr:hypothetical protein KR018_004586 [Drosophila ironensis]
MTSNSWHVRTKENIARVRKDEAEAQAAEQARKEKLELAESEARINFLRRQACLPESASASTSTSASAPKECREQVEKQSGAPAGAVDLFADYRSHVKTTNKDSERERKEEQEKYEKQIGYLTYLGQDTNEALKTRSWYEVAPQRHNAPEDLEEKLVTQKQSHDPLSLINSLLQSKKNKAIKTAPQGLQGKLQPSTKNFSSERASESAKKHKKSSKKHKYEKKYKNRHKNTNKESNLDAAEVQKREKLERLRRERLRREEAERQRSEALFASKESVNVAPTPTPTPRIVQKYSNQFNPELAKQNMI